MLKVTTITNNSVMLCDEGTDTRIHKPAHYIMQRTDNVKRLPTKHSVPTVRVCVQHLKYFAYKLWDLRPS